MMNKKYNIKKRVWKLVINKSLSLIFIFLWPFLVELYYILRVKGNKFQKTSWHRYVTMIKYKT